MHQFTKANVEWEPTARTAGGIGTMSKPGIDPIGIESVDRTTFNRPAGTATIVLGGFVAKSVSSRREH